MKTEYAQHKSVKYSCYGFVAIIDLVRSLLKIEITVPVYDKLTF